MCINEGTLQAYLDSELGPEQRDAVAAHINTCDRCRARAATAAARHTRVETFMNDTVVDTDCESTMAALARFRERAAASPTEGPSRTPRLAVLVRAGVAAAALAVVAIAFLLSGSRTGQPTARGPAAGTKPGPPPRSAAQSADAGAPAVVIPIHQNRAPAPGSSRRPHVVRRSSDTDPYFVLTADASPPEMGIVVRISMPLSLLTMGAGASPGDATQPRVEADVLVGQDGRARAIRFVNQTLTSGGK